MAILPRRIATARLFLAGLLAGGMPAAGGMARAQAVPPGQTRPDDAGPTDRADPIAKPAGGQSKVEEAVAAKPKARAQAPRREPSEEYKESIRKTVERRRQRRARRAQGQGTDDPRPVGAIVPWPMPPALIVRQTPQVHDEVGSLLDVLRRAR